jgi:AraC-like DNA-binding protein
VLFRSVCAAGFYGEHIADLIALALGARGDARALIEQRGVRTVRRDAILREITRHLADPELSAATVGSRLGITARYVGRLLEETGRSFSEHLLDQRLRRAAVLLRGPGAPARKIAYRVCLRLRRPRRYGATPSDMREAARRAED